MEGVGDKMFLLGESRVEIVDTMECIISIYIYVCVCDLCVYEYTYQYMYDPIELVTSFLGRMEP